MKNKYKILLISMPFLYSSLTLAAGPTDIDREQLKTQIEIRNIQMERYKIERQMMLDLNDLKNTLSKSPSEREKLEKSFPILDKEAMSYDALRESRNAD